MALERVSLDVLYRFQRRSKLPLSSFLADLSAFLNGGAGRIISFYRGVSSLFPDRDFDTLNGLLDRIERYIDVLKVTPFRYPGQEHFLMFQCFEEMKSLLFVIRDYNRFIGSSVSSVPFEPTVRRDITLSQGQTLEDVERDILGSEDARNTWVSFAVSKRIREEDYDYRGGYRLSADFARDVRENGRNTQIFDIIDSPVKLLGIDISKDMSYDIRLVDSDRHIDFKLLSYDDTFVQSIDTLGSLARGDNPFYPEYGFDRETIGSEANFTTFYNQLVASFASDESIRSFEITDAYRQGVALGVRVSVESIFGLVEARDINLDPSLEDQRFELDRRDDVTGETITQEDIVNFPIRIRVGEQVYFPSFARNGVPLIINRGDLENISEFVLSSNLFIPLEAPSGGSINVVVRGGRGSVQESVIVSKGIPSIQFVLRDSSPEFPLNASSDSPVNIQYTSEVIDDAISGNSIDGYYAGSRAGNFFVVRADTAGDSNYFGSSVRRAYVNKDVLISISTLEQLNAVRYDMDGDGEVSFTTGTTVSGMVTEQEELSRYASHFSGGMYFTRVTSGGTDTDTEISDPEGTDVLPSTTYVYKVSTTISYAGYQLVGDLDFSGSRWAEGATGDDAVTGGWNPIGDNSTDSNASRFTSIFYGNGHTISNLYIDRDSTDYVGLFGRAGASSRLVSIRLLGVSITGQNQIGGLVGRVDEGYVYGCHSEGSVNGGTSVGGLVGIIEDGNITFCRSSGTISGSVNAGGLLGESVTSNLNICIAERVDVANGSTTANRIGGLVGFNRNGNIRNSFSSGTVTISSDGTGVGGLVGTSNHNNVSDSTNGIFNCYSFVNVRVVEEMNEELEVSSGGLVGRNTDGGIIRNCYSFGDVDGGSNSASYSGGLVGENLVDTIIGNSYTRGSVSVKGSSTIGGLAANNTGTIETNSYFDTDVLGIATGDGAQSTSSLQTPTSNTGLYTTWDEDVWDFGTSSEYPVLKIDFGNDGDTVDDIERQRS